MDGVVAISPNKKKIYRAVTQAGIANLGDSAEEGREK